jgi:putative ubiquitin-RnfH superfamily antitoxin RatB of RatAB toxin-antitoxin module
LAFPDRQYLEALRVPVGCTAREAVARSGLDALATGIDLASAPLGIFGNELSDPDAHPLSDGDRVEVYRPLLLDPKEIRRVRAERAKRRARAERPGSAGDPDAPANRA